MNEVILIKCGELALKGLNRSSFESVLMKNIRQVSKPFGSVKINKSQSTMYVRAQDDSQLDRIEEAISRVFGIAALSRAGVCEKDMDAILPMSVQYLAKQLEACSTFKVEAKRSDKKFPLKSPQICAVAGEYILDKFPHLTVNVHEPDIIVHIEVRDDAAYIHGKPIQGAGGLPVGTGGRAAVMISGGIDSPVASWMMAKRGIELSAIHFASPPYTSERAERKVIDLLGAVSRWAGVIKLHIVPFTEIQEQIRSQCPEELFTIIMRRYMIKIAQLIARQDDCQALISGESLGQVASQTLGALVCTDSAADMPVLRPLIGMDKDEIIRISRKIETFEISILPFEDCCTVFTPKHPRTRPTLSQIEAAESELELDGLIEQAVADVRKVWISPWRR